MDTENNIESDPQAGGDRGPAVAAFGAGNAPTKMVSLRSFRLATRHGHIITVVAKQPFNCPFAAVQDAMQAGCVPYKLEDAPFLDDLGRAKAEFTGDLRRSLVLLAIDSLVKENKAKNFEGNGAPKVTVLSDRVGFDITKDERTRLYREYHSLRSNNEELQVHPQAELVQRVIDADTREELTQLFPDVGINSRQVQGTSTRDLKKLMLSKFSGLLAD